MFEKAHDRAPVSEHDAPRWSHDDLAEARASLHQLCPHDGLELRDLVADRRTRVAEATRSRTEAPFLGNCDERDERAHLEARPEDDVVERLPVRTVSGHVKRTAGSYDGSAPAR
jgi:hypothetical protein